VTLTNNTDTQWFVPELIVNCLFDNNTLNQQMIIDYCVISNNGKLTLTDINIELFYPKTDIQLQSTNMSQTQLAVNQKLYVSLMLKRNTSSYLGSIMLVFSSQLNVHTLVTQILSPNVDIGTRWYSNPTQLHLITTSSVANELLFVNVYCDGDNCKSIVFSDIIIDFPDNSCLFLVNSQQEKSDTNQHKFLLTIGILSSTALMDNRSTDGNISLLTGDRSTTLLTIPYHVTTSNSAFFNLIIKIVDELSLTMNGLQNQLVNGAKVTLINKPEGFSDTKLTAMNGKCCCLIGIQ
jgi:hypothetical protein